MAKISVIIVNYNAGQLLVQAVSSVINFRGVEVIVVDNASQDDSIAQLKRTIKLKKLKIILNRQNLGFGRAVNQAVKHASGDYIYLLNPDASLSEQALIRMVQTAKSYQDKAVIAPRLENPDGSAQASCYQPQTIWRAIQEFWLGQKGAYSKYLPQGRNPQEVYAAVAAAWLVPRQLWQSLQGLNEKFFLYFEDLDFCDRAHKRGFKIIYDPQAIVKHHHGVSSRTNPIVMKLFLQSAYKYHGWFKKILLDFIIKIGNLFQPPFTFKKITLLFWGWFSILHLLPVLGYFLLPSRYQPLSFIHSFWRSNFLFWSWANFDGEHYLSIAKYGYHFLNGFPQYAFFPLFPLLIKTVSFFIGDYFLAAKLLVALFSFIALFFFIRWLQTIKINHPAKVILAFIFFPGIVFLPAIYTESLFLSLTFATMYFTEKRRWPLAALAAGLATATRVNGVFTALFFLIKFFTYHHSFKKTLLWLPLAFSGLIGYLSYLWLTLGRPLAFYQAQSAWGKSHLTSPITLLTNYTRALTTEFVFDLTHLVVIIEVLSLLLGLYLVLAVIRSRRLGMAYLVYLFLNLALPLATGSLGSLPRFLLALAPAFVVFDTWTTKKFLLLLTSYFLLLTFGTILFTRGYWYA